MLVRPPRSGAIQGTRPPNPACPRISVRVCFVYGRSEQQIRPGEAIRYASELKNNFAVRAAGHNERTVLGFDMEPPHASSAPTVPGSFRDVARTVSADDWVLTESEFAGNRTITRTS